MNNHTNIGLKAKNLIFLKSIVPIPNFIIINPGDLLQIYNSLEIPDNLSPDNPEEIQKLSKILISKINSIPSEISNSIMNKIINANLQEPLIIRSCASIEDINIKYNILAGIFESIRSIKGKNEIEQGILKVIKSLYSPKSIFQMLIMGISIKSVSMGIIIQEYIEGDYYGVVFSHNPITAKKQLIIEYSKNPEAVTLGKGETNIIYESNHNDKTNSKNALNEFVISKIKDYTNICLDLTKYPIDMEFVIKDDELYILQIRELILYPKIKKKEIKDKFFIKIGKGIVSSPGFCSGIGKFIDSYSEEIKEKVKDNEIIVSEVLDLGILPWIANAKGFCTIASGYTSHASIIARQMKKPMLIGLNLSKSQLKILDGKELIIKAEESEGYILSNSIVKNLIVKKEKLSFYFLNWKLSDLFSFELDKIKSVIFRNNHLILIEKPNELIVLCDPEENAALIDQIKIYFKHIYSKKKIRLGYIDEYYELWPILVVYRSNKEDFDVILHIKELFEDLKFFDIKNLIQKKKSEIDKLHINLQKNIKKRSDDQIDDLFFLYKIIQQIRLKTTLLTALNRLLFDFGDRTLTKILKQKFEVPAVILSQIEQGIPLKSLGIQDQNSFSIIEFYQNLTKLKNSMEIRFDELKLNKYNIIYDKIQKVSKLNRRDFGSWDILLFKISKKLDIKNNLFDLEYDE